MGNRDKKEKEKPKDRQAAAAIAVDEHETDQPVTMAVVRELLQAQESRSQFESVVQSLEKRVHDVEKSVKEIKTSLEYTQKDVDELKPLQSKIVMANEEINKLNTDLSSKSLSMEYLENQSRRNNIRVNGIPESPRETWEETEKKVIETVRNKLGVNIDIERAHKVMRKPKPGNNGQSDSSKPRTIVCRLRDWKQKEQVLRKARKKKPRGLFITEDIALSTQQKREPLIPKLKAAK